MYFRIRDSVYSRLFRLLYSRRFARFGQSTHLLFPTGVDGVERIALGDDVYIAHACYLAAVPHTGAAECRLDIGTGSRIGKFNHIYATRRVVLEPYVLTANGVYISDNLHEYGDIRRPVLRQPIRQTADVVIGEGSWIGHNACVIGARVGRHCVIGANAVVRSDIPDYSVAVGAPAVVVRRYDPASESWKATDPAGAFA
jgi:acetyltransferase-like isoleucine patch superfamily enzyme